MRQKPLPITFPKTSRLWGGVTCLTAGGTLEAAFVRICLYIQTKTALPTAPIASAHRVCNADVPLPRWPLKTVDGKHSNSRFAPAFQYPNRFLCFFLFLKKETFSLLSYLRLSAVALDHAAAWLSWRNSASHRRFHGCGMGRGKWCLVSLRRLRAGYAPRIFPFFGFILKSARSCSPLDPHPPAAAPPADRRSKKAAHRFPLSVPYH